LSHKIGSLAQPQSWLIGLADDVIEKHPKHTSLMTSSTKNPKPKN